MPDGATTSSTAHYTAAATASGRDGRAVSSDGRLDLPLALPREMGGSGEGTNPEQLFAAGYAACFASALSAVARAERHDVRDVSVTAEVGIGGDVESGFGLSVVLRVELPDELAGDTGRALVEQAHQVCPYSNATRGNIPVELVVE
ncbi:organic hydroperoxide resistance protein [Actinomadura rugatobispora]|uniref:Organic hydroperoxide resistance protein n=1 Tax=Actinomadura rugatobispora TaxID=1994 RepID=A0ABW1A0N9_9ACTN|nr:organic hydroperoxide resistance protein [Actinomadura rugatobispora]